MSSPSHLKARKKYYESHKDLERERSRIRMQKARSKKKESTDQEADDRPPNSPHPSLERKYSERQHSPLTDDPLPESSGESTQLDNVAQLRAHIAYLHAKKEKNYSVQPSNASNAKSPLEAFDQIPQLPSQPSDEQSSSEEFDPNPQLHSQPPPLPPPPPQRPTRLQPYTPVCPPPGMPSAAQLRIFLEDLIDNYRVGLEFLHHYEKYEKIIEALERDEVESSLLLE
ncbi:hypothetical protein BJ912DRAFT_348894 [Pholiota molesta]|nr:hypothetical protein BJ912DRAFT_348894 [Pholiota molesta]